MNINKRSLRGYTKSSIRLVTEQLQQEHMLRMEGLKEELQVLREETAKLQQELLAAETRQAGAAGAGPEAAHQEAMKLYEGHAEQTRAVAGEISRLKGWAEESKLAEARKLEERLAAARQAEEEFRKMLERIPQRKGGSS